MEQASLWLACLLISLSSFTPYMHCLPVEREQMERYRTMRAYSAGGVVFRLVPRRSTNKNSTVANANQQRVEQETAVPARDLSVEVALVGRSHAGHVSVWTLPKGTPRSGETIEQ